MKMIRTFIEPAVLILAVLACLVVLFINRACIMEDPIYFAACAVMGHLAYKFMKARE